MTRFLPARHYVWFGAAALLLAGFSGWLGLDWTPAFVPCVLFLLSSALLFLLAFRPPIDVHEGYLAVGKRIIPWMDVRRLDRTGWVSPLIMRLTLFDDSKVIIVYAGDLESCNGLLRHLRRLCRDAMIDGIPYRQYWGEALGPSSDRTFGPRQKILRAEDEAEVERLYQRLKTVGHLDQKNSDEK